MIVLGAILVFLAIYAPVLRVGERSIDTQFVFFLASLTWVPMLSRRRRAIVAQNMISPQMFCLGALVIWGLVISFPDLVSGTSDLHAVLRPIRAMVTLGGCAAIFALLFRTNPVSTVRRMIVWCLLAATMHGLIMIAQFLFPALRELMYPYIAGELTTVGARYNYSMAGLTNGGGSQLSVYQAMGFLLIPYVWKASARLSHRLLTLPAGVVCLLSVFLAGRSGLIAIALFGPLAMMHASGFSAMRLMKFFLGFFLVGSLLFFSTRRSDWLGAAQTEGLVAIGIRAESIFFGEDETVDILKEHVILPTKIRTWLVGQPALIARDQGTADRILDSDIGYIRILHGYGVLGSILHYGFYLGIMAAAFPFLWSGRRDLAILAGMNLIFAAVILLFQAKEIFVFTRMGLSYTCLLFMAFQRAADGSTGKTSSELRVGIRAGAGHAHSVTRLGEVSACNTQ